MKAYNWMKAKPIMINYDSHYITEWNTSNCSENELDTIESIQEDKNNKIKNSSNR